MILRFMSRTYEIYAEKLKATKRLVELIDDDVASDVELTLDRPSNVVCWSQVKSASKAAVVSGGAMV